MGAHHVMTASVKSIIVALHAPGSSRPVVHAGPAWNLAAHRLHHVMYFVPCHVSHSSYHLSAVSCRNGGGGYHWAGLVACDCSCVLQLCVT